VTSDIEASLGAGDNDGAATTAARSSTPVPKIGVWSWTFVGFVVALAIVVTAFGVVSEILLPLLFAAVLAVIFKPVVVSLIGHRFKPSLAAGMIVLGLLLLMVCVLVGTIRGIADQKDEISASLDAAIAKFAESSGADPATLEDLRQQSEEAAPAFAEGIPAKLLAGVGSIVALAGGIILGALIMYYLLKDGAKLRRAVVAQVEDPGIREDVDGFIGDACQILRNYGSGRTVMSAIVSVVIGIAALLMGLPLVFTIVVVNFVGGYIPYIGAFLGVGLAVIVALGDGGIGQGALMLVIVLAANLILENFVEPKVMGKTLDIHPLTVLVVTALGGLLGGIVGLILAVPFTVIAGNAVGRLRRRGVISQVADKAQPAVKDLLQ